MTTAHKLISVRAFMKAHQLDAFIIPSSDPHQSEYVAEHWQARTWLSEFTGSAGTLVVTQTHAGLWTDSRYFLQAEEQLANNEFELHRMSLGKGLEYDRWLSQALPKGSRIACNGLLFSKNQIKYITLAFQAVDFELVTDLAVFDEVWTDRPSLPTVNIFEHDIKFAGQTRNDKLAEVRKVMAESHADYYLISALDELAWLLNLRGSDVECNPTFYAYVIITQKDAFVFMDTNKLLAELREKLSNDGVTLRPYSDITTFLKGITTNQTVLLDPITTSIRLSDVISCRRLERESMIRLMKCIKNEVELDHFNATMAKDGVALVRAYRWLEAELKTRSIPEAEFADQIAHFRAQQSNYFGESFHAIVGDNANGAIVHYRPEHGSCAEIKKEGMLLVDSGGQYLDGTTDITRTIALSTPSAVQKKDFTLVLKGHIALASARFPAGTNGVQLDTFARIPIWEEYMNYGHGTGHGIGFFLNVHESPPKFAPTTNGRGATVLKPNMVMSNEPGIYKAGEYGIRTENLMRCVPDKASAFGQFLTFETITVYPLDNTLVERSMLSEKEITWYNNYQRKVFKILAPLLDTKEVQWLEGQCQTL